MEVQEVTKSIKATPVQGASNKVKGLINLRGRVATAIYLGKIFSVNYAESESFMTIGCDNHHGLFSFVVDRVGDVITLNEDELQSTPEASTLSDKHLLSGVFQLENKLLRILNLESLILFLENDYNKGEAA